MVHGLCVLLPLVGLTAHLRFRTFFWMAQSVMDQNPDQRGCCACHWGFHGNLLSDALRAAQARDRDLYPALEGALHLMHSSDAEDFLQLMIHLVQPINGGCGYNFQKCNHYGHILASPSKGRLRRTITVDGIGNIPTPSLGSGEFNCYAPLCLERGLVVVQFGQLGLDDRSLTGELISPLCSPTLVVNLSSAGSRLFAPPGMLVVAQ
jgi:hypothetical protein